MFKIETEFVDWMGRREFKTETTDNWEQAFGAFAIYVGNGDCVCAGDSAGVSAHPGAEQA